MSAIIYLLQVSACMGLFYLFYYFRLSRLTFFTINRWYLLATLVLSFVIPALTIHVHQDSQYVPVIQQARTIYEIKAPANLSGQIQQAVVEKSIDWVQVLKLIYCLVAAALFIHLVITLLNFFTKLKNKKVDRIGRVNVMRGNKQLSNGSFLNYIFLNDDELSPAEMQQIIAHEMLHVKLFHSADRIIAKIIQIILWFNPFVYLYIRSIEENHEFEVDRAITLSTDKNNYADLLLHLSVAANGTLYHNFSKVPLKKRITMLFDKPSGDMKRIIYVGIIPLVVLSCAAFARLKNDEAVSSKLETSLTDTVKYRQKTKLTAAQRAKLDAETKAEIAYQQTDDAKQKSKLIREISSKEVTVKVKDIYKNKQGEFRGFVIQYNNQDLVLLTWYGQDKALNSMLKPGDVITMKGFDGAWSKDMPATIGAAYVIKNNKKIFQLAEAGKIPDYPFLYEANKVRFAEGQISNIEKYANGKWKNALFETVNGYKFYLSFKPTAPAMESIKWGDHVRLRFVHEVKTGAKDYVVNDWVSITTNVHDYGIKNPEFFNKFYEVVPEIKKHTQTSTQLKTDSRLYSAVEGLEKLGKTPLVLIDNQEYPTDILYKIGKSCINGSGVFEPKDAMKIYGDRAKDGLVTITTKNHVITYLTAIDKENLAKEAVVPANRFYTRIELKKENGDLEDKIIMHPYTGGSISATIAHRDKAAYFIDKNFYDENTIKKVSPATLAAIKGEYSVEGNKHYWPQLKDYTAVFHFSTKDAIKTDTQ